MNKQKQVSYEAPTTDVLELRFEGMVCTSPQYGVLGGAGANQEYNNYGDDF